MKKSIFLLCMLVTQNVLAAGKIASTCSVNRIIQKPDTVQVILRQCIDVKCPKAPANDKADLFMKTSDRMTTRYLNMIQSAFLFDKKVTILAGQASATSLQCRFRKIESVHIH